MNLRNLRLEENQIEILICDSYHNIIENLEDYIDDIFDIGMLLQFSKCTNITYLNEFDYNIIQTPITECIDNILNRLKEIRKNLKDQTSYNKESIDVINYDFKLLVKFYGLLNKYNKHNFSLTIVGLDDITVETISDFKIKNLSLAIKKYKNKRDKFINKELTENFIEDINKTVNTLNKKRIFKKILLDEENISIINMNRNKNIVKFDLHFYFYDYQLFHSEKDIFLINLIEELEQLNIGWDNQPINMEEDILSIEEDDVVKISFYQIF